MANNKKKIVGINTLLSILGFLFVFIGIIFVRFATSTLSILGGLLVGAGIILLTISRK